MSGLPKSDKESLKKAQPLEIEGAIANQPPSYCQKLWLLGEFFIPLIAQSCIDSNLGTGLSVGFLIWHWFMDDKVQKRLVRGNQSNLKTRLSILSAIALIFALLTGCTIPNAKINPHETTELIKR